MGKRNENIFIFNFIFTFHHQREIIRSILLQYLDYNAIAGNLITMLPLDILLHVILKYLHQEVVLKNLSFKNVML